MIMEVGPRWLKRAGGSRTEKALVRSWEIVFWNRDGDADRDLGLEKQGEAYPVTRDRRS